MSRPCSSTQALRTETAMRTDWARSVADGRFRLRVPAPISGLLPDQPVLLAGAAEVDLTPPPGMPKAGHSKNAHDGTGFRTRIKARVVHLRRGEVSLALIACDLLAGSALLHRVLAAEITDTDVPAEGLFLGATHTHAGPGQYSGSEFYNHWSANRPGFDPDYTRFVLDQLSAAVHEAVGTRSRARAAVGTTEVWGFTRNRALGAHVRNAGLLDRRTEAQRKYAAVDPRLHQLRVDGDAGPLAVFSWFSIHGTGISHHDTSYNADVWAYLNGELVDRVEAATGLRPVSGAVVGSHGDMTPAVRPGMLVFHEAERVGRGIGRAAAALHSRLGENLRDDLPLRCALREVDLADGPSYGGIRLPPPRIGWAKTAGAIENETPVLHLVPPFRAGFGRRHPQGPHGAKRIAGTEAGHAIFVAPDKDFPHVLPLQLIELGELTVVGLPFETTVEAGRRIASAVGPEAFVSSLANDHCDYLTTAEEYSAQYYEGASTVFGPRQQDFVASAVGRLHEDLGDHPRLADLHERAFDFTVGHHLARPTGSDVQRTMGRVRFVEATRTEDAYWQQAWTDVPPGDLRWHEPMVQVEAEGAGGWTVVADDQGWYLGIEYLGAAARQHRYVSRWYRPPLGRPGRHRFVLAANNGRPESTGPTFD